MGIPELTLAFFPLGEPSKGQPNYRTLILCAVRGDASNSPFPLPNLNIPPVDVLPCFP